MFSLKHRALAAGFAATLTLAPFSIGAVSASADAPRVPSDAATCGVAEVTPVTRAGDFIAAEYAADPSAVTDGALADAILALASTGTHQAEARQMWTALAEQTPGYATNVGAAGKVALAAMVMGEDPTNVNGVNLIDFISTKYAADPTGGGVYSSPFGILALHHHGDTVPKAVIDALVKLQDASGAYGYNYNGFNADPDATAFAMTALVAVKADPDAAAALEKAVAWATANQQADGSWQNYVPVNTTGMMGAALDDAGLPQAKATTWMLAQQVTASDDTDGALTNQGSPDLFATVQGVLLLAKTSYATLTSYAPAPQVTPCTTPSPSASSSVTPTPSVSATPSASTTTVAPSAAPTTTAPGRGLPKTGDDTGLLPLMVIVSVGAAGGLATLRRTR